MKKTVNRRTFISYLAATMVTPYVVTYSIGRANAGLIAPDAPLNYDSARVFSLSISSGDPTPSGVILWTRIDPSAYVPTENLVVQVAADANFTQLVFESFVPAEEISEATDYTVKLDLDTHLESYTRYYYRFIYTNTVSRTGRCRTAPPYGVEPTSLKLGMVTCQDYTNGYYGALNYLADDDTIDYVLHLGDFIYESAGDPRFQSLPFEDRLIVLPSDEIVAMDLADYRHLYRTYRSDAFLQKALENHTFIMTRDDHETSNDAYWDYTRDTLGAPDHPYTTREDFGNDPIRLMQLMLDSQQAWAEYVPVRLQINPGATHPHQFLKHYRRVQLGTLVDLFMLDTRSYRSAHACGEDDFFERYFPIGCNEWKSEDQTMMGGEQRDWLFNGLADSSARWKVLGNQTYMGSLGLTFGNYKIPFNVDAWDGFDYERIQMAELVRDQKIENFVVLTGDLHTFMASHVKLDYLNKSIFNYDNFLGVEFMTPSVTSAGLFDMLSIDTPTGAAQWIAQGLTNTAVRLTNPHVRYFNTVQNGYSTVEFKQDYCDWRAYAIDKGINSATPGIKEIRHYRKYTTNPWLVTATD